MNFYELSMRNDLILLLIGILGYITLLNSCVVKILGKRIIDEPRVVICFTK